MTNRGQGDVGTFASIHNNGYAVFINNIEARGNDGKYEFVFRKGANEDTSNLQNVFITNLGMKWLNTDCFQSLTTEEWDHRKSKNASNVNEESCRCIKCRIKHTDHSPTKCFVLAISSHGRELTETEIIFSDGNSILLSEILDALNDANCPSLAGKQRIIILNTCRGNFIDREQVDRAQDRGVEMKVQKMTLNDSPQVTSQAGTPSTDNPTMKIRRFTVDRVEDLTLQHAALGKMPNNYLLIYPVVSGQRAWSSTEDGSWLIQGMKKIVQEKYVPSNQPINFLNLLTQVSGYVAREKESVKYKQRKENQSPTGNQGNQSTTGNQGNQSTAENIGNQSATGNQGNQSTTGNQGNQSTTGNKGNQSNAENIGNQAATGNQDDNQSATGNIGNQSATENIYIESATGNQGNQSPTGNQSNQSPTENEGNQSECENQVTQDGQKSIRKTDSGDLVIGDWVKDEEKSGFKNAVCFHHRLVEPIIFYPERKEVELPKVASFASGTK